MIVDIEWRAWSHDQLVDKLPSLLDEIEPRLQVFSEEYREKNRSVITSFRTEPLSINDLRTGSRNWELSAIGFALDSLGRQSKDLGFEDRLKLFQAAHEIFRAGNRTSHPAKPQQQTLSNALRIIINHGVDRIEAGEGDTGVLREDIERFVVSAWGSLPASLTLTANEMVLTELERVRASRENDKAFYERFVRDNIEAVLAMEIPTRLERVLDTWLDSARHVAPTAVRMAQHNFRRPKKLSELLSTDVWGRIEHAVERGDAAELGEVLSGVEESLESNLRLRLNARTEYREPASELRFQGGVDRFFREAYQLLTQRDRRALDKFRDIHRRRFDHTVAKEWYAYALTQFGRPTDIHDVIELLEDAIQSEYFRPVTGWTARWNLACALRKLHNRANESLPVLLPVLDDDFHVSDAFELCLLWALEQDREKELDTLLLKSPYHEAHLLIALYDSRRYSQNDDPERFQYHFRRINRILRDRDRTFFDPNERLTDGDLDDLTEGFIEDSLVAAGVEWFRQRLANDRERRFFKNWDCAAKLNEEADDLAAAWRCREQQWNCTQNNRSLDPGKKAGVLRFLLSWAEHNGFKDDGLRLLRQSWRKTSMTDADVQLWERRLAGTPAAVGQKPPTVSPGGLGQYDHVATGQKPDTPSPMPLAPTPTELPEIKSLEEAEAVIQTVAGTFRSVGNADALANREADAHRLLAAAMFKHEDIPAELVAAVREVIRLSSVFRRGVDEEQSQTLAIQMRNQIEQLRKHRARVPFELNGLVESCERVSQNMSVRVRAVPEPSITPPADLKVTFDVPAPGETYLTRACARVANPASEDMRNLTVAFTSTSPHVHIITSEIPIPRLATQDSHIAECPVRVEDGIEELIDLCMFVSYEIGGVKRSLQSGGRIAVRPVGEPIPTTVRYVTDKPVAADRKDLFHGRDRELKDLPAAFAGGEMRKLYFVNGIRRVGKSSLIIHLGQRCGPDVLPLVLNVEQALEGTRMPPVQFVRQLIRQSIELIEMMKDVPPVSLSLPTAAELELDPPWTVFDDFLRKVRQQTQRRNVLLCFDEVQRLVSRIADPEDPMDEGFLSWLRGKIQSSAGVLIVCTGSEPYGIMRNRLKQHTIWGNMEPYNVSFVDKTAMKKIATQPVEPDGVVWMPESLERLWDMTEGHPWVIQILAEKVCEHLNQERRRVVMPGDLDAAADDVLMTDPRVSELWWNESDGLITKEHRQIAFLILQNQEPGRRSVLETRLGEICQRAGLRKVGAHLDEMKALELLSTTMEGTYLRWHIRGVFLEKYLMMLEQRERTGKMTPASTPAQNRPLALMLDWENVKIGLSKYQDKQPTAKAQELRPRLETAELAKRLHDAATRHGKPRQRWAVANWDKPFFAGDQANLKKQIRYETDMSGSEKANASDHVLRERIHEVLREHSEIEVYVIATGDGDFVEAIRTLQSQGKHVILWSTRDAMNPEYKYLLAGPDPILIEWLEDLVFGPETSP